MSEELTLFEKLERDGYTEEAVILKEYYRNAILLHCFQYCYSEVVFEHLC